MHKLLPQPTLTIYSVTKIKLAFGKKNMLYMVSATAKKTKNTSRHVVITYIVKHIESIYYRIPNFGRKLEELLSGGVIYSSTVGSFDSYWKQRSEKVI